MEGSGGGVKAAARFSRVMEAAAAGEDGEEPLRSARRGRRPVPFPEEITRSGAALAFGSASPRGRRGRKAGSGVCCWEGARVLVSHFYFSTGCVVAELAAVLFRKLLAKPTSA